MFKSNARFVNFVIAGVNPYPVLETIPFVASGAFAVAFAVISEQPNKSQFYSFWSVAAILCILSMAVWYAGTHKKYVVPNRLIIEVLEAARAALGSDNIRLNIMELEDPHDHHRSYFRITHATSNMKAPASYDRKFTTNTKGVGGAYSSKQGDVYLTTEEDDELDSFPTVIWSIPIIFDEKVVAILNIDTNIENHSDIQHERMFETGYGIIRCLLNTR